MPRNLTDLMEAAVSAAPPETHHASDITRLAARHQRRRTTFVAGAAALAVIAVGGGAFGLTRGQDSTPEPAAPYKYGQELDAKDAVAATSVRGFRVLPWTQPSVQNLSSGIVLPNYTGVDASGRLIVQTYGGTNVAELRTIRLYDAPGQPAAPLRTPVSTGKNPQPWVPSFTGDGRLLWTTNATDQRPTVHVTDLSGGADVTAPGGRSTVGQTSDWVTGDSVWYAVSRTVTTRAVESSGLYTKSLSGGTPAHLVAKNVVAADVSDGRAAWVTTDGRLHVAHADGSGVRDVPVPLDAGCAVTPGPYASDSQPVAVMRGVVALRERCGKGGDQLLAFDMSGRLLVHVKGLEVGTLSMSGTSLAFDGTDAQQFEENFVYDLRTGTLASLGQFQGRVYPGSPQVAGRYVLWYDGAGGHVGEFSH